MKAQRQRSAKASSGSAATLEQDRADRARLWDEGKLSGKDWIQDEDSIPRAQESEQISIRLPKRLLSVLRGLAKRRSIGYQVLLRDLLDERVREEARRELVRLGRAPAEARVLVFKASGKLGIAPERLEDSKSRRHHLLARTAR